MEADGVPPVVVDDVGWAAHLVVRGARELGLLKLVDFLPPVPAGGRVCPGCDGRRWDDTPSDGFPEGGTCLICKGLGWRPLRTG